MATRFIESGDATAAATATQLATLKADTPATVAPILYDPIDGYLKYYDRVNSVVRQLASVTGQIPFDAPATSLTLTAALHAGRTIAMNEAAGTAFTLPAATGTGNVYRFVVTVASNANTVVAAGSDKLSGGIMIVDSGASSATLLYGARATVASHTTYTPTTAGGGGAIGDYVEFHDVLAAVWAVRGMAFGATDPTNPFS